MEENPLWKEVLWSAMMRWVEEPAFSTQLEETDEGNRAFDEKTEWSLDDACAGQ